MHGMAWHGVPQCRRGRGPISSWGLLGPRPTIAGLARNPVRISDCRRTENGDGVEDKGRWGDAEGHMPLRTGRSYLLVHDLQRAPHRCLELSFERDGAVWKRKPDYRNDPPPRCVFRMEPIDLQALLGE